MNSPARIFLQEFAVPEVDISPERIRMVMISESAPLERKDAYYAGEDALFAQTTLLAISGCWSEQQVPSRKLVDQGIYFTTAVKMRQNKLCYSNRYDSGMFNLLEKELHNFPM